MAACAQALLGDDEPEGSQLLGMMPLGPLGLAACGLCRAFPGSTGQFLAGSKLLQWIWADNPRIRRL
jgi:hypothetical protein